MKKWIETMVALIVAFVLMGSVVGCGQAVPDQGEVDPKDNTEEDQAAESVLIGKVRVVPIIRQNALAIVAPRMFMLMTIS